MFGRVSRETMKELKQEARTTQRIEDTLNNLSCMFKKYIKEQDKKIGEIEKIAAECSETPFIKIQNGLIKEQGLELVKQGKTQNKIFGMLIFAGAVTSFLLIAVYYM